MSSDPFELRPLLPADLPEAFALQAQAYAAHLRDGRAAFESRLTLGPDTCWVARRDGVLVGYLLSHPWASMTPPPVDTVLEEVPTSQPTVHYIHDVSIADAARGSGLAVRLVQHALEAARARGLTRSELIAVQGAEGFWRRRGYAPEDLTPELALKLRSYGPDARYLSRAL